MKRAYALVVSYHDGSAILRAFGPYPTEDAAKAAEPDLQDLYYPDGIGKWEVVPMYAITMEDTAPAVTKTCTATLASPIGGTVFRCTQDAGHYDESAEPNYPDPGGWHFTANGMRGSSSTWSDSAEGATPHADTTTED